MKDVTTFLAIYLFPKEVLYFFSAFKVGDRLSRLWDCDSSISMNNASKVPVTQNDTSRASIFYRGMSFGVLFGAHRNSKL